MTAEAFADRIRDRLHFAAVPAATTEIEVLGGFLAVLAKWNARINLTAFDLGNLNDEAIDRLIVEPVAASRHVWPYDQTLLDLGSGGGSPAIPMKIMCSALRLVMVESRTRKAAFLREAVRTLGLEQTSIENDRYELVASRDEIRGKADIVTFRAVRADAALWTTLETCLKPGGRAFWFGPEPRQPSDLPSPLILTDSHKLSAAGSGWLAIAELKYS